MALSTDYVMRTGANDPSKIAEDILSNSVGSKTGNGKPLTYI